MGVFGRLASRAGEGVVQSRSGRWNQGSYELCA